MAMSTVTCALLQSSQDVPTDGVQTISEAEVNPKAQRWQGDAEKHKRSHESCARTVAGERNR